MSSRLAFVYSDEFRGSGSTVMRGDQLAEIARTHLRKLSVSVIPLGASVRRTTLFFTKGAARTATPEQLAELRARGNRILFDVLDEKPPPTTAEFADALVASSLSAFVDLPRAYPSTPVVLVNHHVDPRLHRAVAGPRPDAFRAGYFGEAINAFRTPAIEANVDIVHIDTSSRDDRWLARVGGYSFHYAVRNTRELDHHKPFLKGFTAAHAGANVMIQRSQREAALWLGDDYPYLVDDPADETAVLAVLERARSDFGTARWADALDVMSTVRTRTSDPWIASELGRAISI